MRCFNGVEDYSLRCGRGRVVGRHSLRDADISHYDRISAFTKGTGRRLAHDHGAYWV
jgi:hypothetical protein